MAVVLLQSQPVYSNQDELPITPLEYNPSTPHLKIHLPYYPDTNLMP